MLNLKVSPTIRAERLKVCKECKWFVPKTSSCGPLLIGKEVDRPTEVRHYKKKVKLCGCNMKIKTALSFASCPADKWLAVSDDPNKVIERGNEIKEYFKSIKGKPSLSGDEVRKVYSYISEVEGRKVEAKHCGPCVREAIKNMNDYLANIEFA